MLDTQITVHDIEHSPAVLANIQKRVDKLEQFYHRICSCRVAVQIPQKHKHQGKLFNIRVEVSVPGKILVATHKVDEDIYVAIRNAFNAMERQLEEYGRKRHGRVKTHQDVLHGHVTRIMSNDGYGFIEGTDGNEYYFSLTNVSYPDFNQLYLGDAVEFMGEILSEGRHAHHVVRERHNNHHYA
ncbi:MAG TPA: ribosome-associated translation inhibitor RaiA [Gammaproteobacteria bacterium]|jgi:ribosomal subunit interface protein|nr:ribosome-associated translation inhibitor RaiA [Gammaproteobacteria bacterium]